MSDRACLPNTTTFHGARGAGWRAIGLGMGAALSGAVICGSGGCKSNPTATTKKGAPAADSIFTAFAPPTPAEAAAWAIDPYDPDKRYRGALLLANAPWGGDPIYIQMYVAALGDSDSSVRSAAVRGLALHGSPEHVPLIIPMLDAEDVMLRWEAARALQRLHNDAAVTPLLKRIVEQTEPDPRVRIAAASALGQYAEMRVLEGLFGALADRDLGVDRAAQESLRTLTGQDFGLNIRAWVGWRRAAADPFAGKTTYIYPVFYRDKTWVETILPFWEPPNEVAAAPVGLQQATNADSKQ